MNFNNFIPIIAKCNQGQAKKGVNKGGVTLYNNIFYKLRAPTIIENQLFNNNKGYNILYEKCINAPKTLVFGGDHSIATATVLASVKKYPNLSVVWIDAHADINTMIASKTKNRHGTPLASCIGLEKVWFNNEIKDKLNSNKLFYTGIRDVDVFENNIINKYKINILSSNEIVNYIINTKDKIHISFDVDALDPTLLDSTGTLAPNGLNVNQVKNIINTALNVNKLVGLDIVELNPYLGNRYKSIDTLKEIFTY